MVKIDVEGAEWSALQSMAEQGDLKSIRQLAIEFHMWDIENVEIHRYALHTLRELHIAGFRIFFSHMYAGATNIVSSDNVYPVTRTLTYEVIIAPGNLHPLSSKPATFWWNFITTVRYFSLINFN